MATGQEWGQALQGMGAWFAGQGPQYEAAKVAQQRTDMEDELLRDERRQKAMVTDFSRAYAFLKNGKPELAVQLLDNRIPEIEKLYGNPKDTIALRDAIADPARNDEAIIELEGFLGAVGALPGGGGAKRTDVFKNGAVLQATSDGSIGLTMPSGQRITPADPMWQQAISEATGSGVQYAGDEAAARAYATQGAQYQYAAPIAAAQAGARADVEAATAPQIAAATVTAEESAKSDVERSNTARTNATSFDAYNQAMSSLAKAFGQTSTGPVAGRLPAVTVSQQSAEGARAAAAPVLKQLFRSAGEGVFTDKDQQLLMDMMPDRKDYPEVAQQKLSTIDAIVKAKLNVGGKATASQPGAPLTKSIGGKTYVLQNGQWFEQ